MSATSRIMLPMALLLSFASLGRSFQVLYVGPPRTGTQTMYTALTILGLRPLHSGYNRSVREPMCNFLYFNGSKKVALNLLNGFDAAMDEPFQLMYDAVMEEFPNAKFILPVTTAEQWMNSYNDFFENSKFPKERRVAAAAQKRLKIKRNTTLEYFDRQQ
ncbi:set5, partial [Symbiodinium necroappetens]